jgi:hypothetical protein
MTHGMIRVMAQMPIMPDRRSVETTRGELAMGM